MTVWYLVITLCSGLNCTITTWPYDSYEKCMAYRERAVASDTENVGIFKCRSLVTRLE